MRKTPILVLLLINVLSVLAQDLFFSADGNVYSEEDKVENLFYVKHQPQPNDVVRTDLSCFIHYTNSQGKADSSLLVANANFSVPIDTTQDISFSVYDADGKKMRIDKHRFRSSCSMGNISQVFEDGETLKSYKHLPFDWNCDLWIIDLKVSDDHGSYRFSITQNGSWRCLQN